jgi:phosphohistidine phosphatase
MLILVFRHGPAGKADPARWPDDRARPLTRRGVKRTLLAAHGLSRLVPAVDLIVTSPLVRAAETARILADVSRTSEPQTLEALSPGGSDRRIMEFLKRHASRDVIVLVGHEPDLGRLVATLAVGAGNLPLKKAGACALRCDEEIGAGKARLVWFAPPSLLRRLGRRKVPA